MPPTVERRPSWIVVCIAPWVMTAVFAGCKGGTSPGCPDATPCPSASVPVVLVVTCDGNDIVQSNLTGPCAGQTLACQAPSDASLVGCTTASFTSPTAGTCNAQLTFANGFVYSGSFNFTEQSGACPSCGPQLVPSPEVVPVYCAPEAGASDAEADAEISDAGGQ